MHERMPDAHPSPTRRRSVAGMRLSQSRLSLPPASKSATYVPSDWPTQREATPASDAPVQGHPFQPIMLDLSAAAGRVEVPLYSASSFASFDSQDTLVDVDGGLTRKQSGFYQPPLLKTETYGLVSPKIGHDSEIPSWSGRSSKETTFKRAGIVLALFVAASLCFTQKERIVTITDNHFRPMPRFQDPCNPFLMPGYLNINTSQTSENYWQPFSASCPRSTLLDDVQTTNPSLHAVNGTQLPWLHNRTIVLIGDSVDRNHLQQFCEFTEGEQQMIGSQHPLSPAPFRNGRDELYKTEGEHAEHLARPWICYVERFDLFLVNVFHYGLVTPEEYTPDWFNSDSHYYPPFALPDRIDHIVAPILASYLRPKADIVSFASSFWDAAYVNRALTGTGYSQDVNSVPAEFLRKFSERLTIAFSQIAESSTFSDASTILWRTPHESNYYNGVPGDVVMGLSAVADQVVEELQKPSRFSAFSWLNPIKGNQDRSNVKKEILQSRIRFENSGRFLTGQRQHISDGVHPRPLPNGKIWSDILLYELKRTVEKKAFDSSLPGPV